MTTDCCTFCGSFGDCYDHCEEHLHFEIDKLKEENAKLRALVERAGELDRAYVGEDMDKFAKECREALK
jgi:hypothetical protein